jgi:hypothetical protein
MHPLVNILDVITDDIKIFERYPNTRLSSNISIAKDIDEHDLVIVSCYSTVFLDTYLNGKYCLRLFPFRSSPAYLKLFDSRIIFNIFSEEDVLEALEKITLIKTPFSIDQEFKEIINIDLESWTALLTDRVPEVSLLN